MRRFFLFSLFGAILLAFPAVSISQDHSMHHDHSSMDMDSMDHAPLDPAAQAKLLADKKESEFNHHLAGLFVILAGIFILSTGSLTHRWPAIKYAWPLCFLVSGIFLLVFSDTELWPFGPKNWWIGITGNLEVMQHKTFAAILLFLGAVEIQRVRGALRAAWSAWVFPVLALVGSTMLLFHAHDAGMVGPNHMQTMAHIQTQHLSYAALGAGIAVSKGLADTGPTRRFFAIAWPLLMIALGTLLVLYTE